MVSSLMKKGLSNDEACDQAYNYYKDDIRAVKNGYISTFSMLDEYFKH